MKGKKKNGLALVISIGQSPKKPTDTATPDMPKKAGYGDGKLKGRMTPILSNMIKELILEKARGTGIPGTQGPPLGGKGPQLSQKTKCKECGGKLQMESAPGMDGAEELTCTVCGAIEDDPYDVVSDVSGADELDTDIHPSLVRDDDDMRRGTPMEIAFRLLKARYASANDAPIDISQWPHEEAITGQISKPRNLGQPLDSEPMAADWLTRTQDDEEYDRRWTTGLDDSQREGIPGLGEMREMRDIDEQRQLALQGDMSPPEKPRSQPGPSSFRDELARRTARGPASNDLRGHQALRALIMRRLMAGETLSTDELMALRGSKRTGHPMDMSFALLKALTNEMPLPTEQEMRFVRENLESADPEKAAHAQMVLDRIEAHPTTQAMADFDYVNENPDTGESNLYNFITEMQNQRGRRGSGQILNAEDASPLDLAMDFLRK